MEGRDNLCHNLVGGDPYLFKYKDILRQPKLFHMDLYGLIQQKIFICIFNIHYIPLKLYPYLGILPIRKRKKKGREEIL
jgi:hypothetical protein